MSKVWVKNKLNSELQGEGFYISFNGNTGSLISVWAGDVPAETAICVEDFYFILNGDHREAFEGLVDEGLNACLRYFQQHPEAHSSWSNSLGQAQKLLADGGSESSDPRSPSGEEQE